MASVNPPSGNQRSELAHFGANADHLRADEMLDGFPRAVGRWLDTQAGSPGRLYLRNILAARQSETTQKSLWRANWSGQSGVFDERLRAAIGEGHVHPFFAKYFFNQGFEGLSGYVNGLNENIKTAAAGPVPTALLTLDILESATGFHVGDHVTNVVDKIRTLRGEFPSPSKFGVDFWRARILDANRHSGPSYAATLGYRHHIAGLQKQLRDDFYQDPEIARHVIGATAYLRTRARGIDELVGDFRIPLIRALADPSLVDARALLLIFDRDRPGMVGALPPNLMTPDVEERATEIQSELSQLDGMTNRQRRAMRVADARASIPRNDAYAPKYIEAARRIQGHLFSIPRADGFIYVLPEVDPLGQVSYARFRPDGDEAFRVGQVHVSAPKDVVRRFLGDEKLARETDLGEAPIDLSTVKRFAIHQEEDGTKTYVPLEVRAGARTFRDTPFVSDPALSGDLESGYSDGVVRIAEFEAFDAPDIVALWDQNVGSNGKGFSRAFGIHPYRPRETVDYLNSLRGNRSRERTVFGIFDDRSENLVGSMRISGSREGVQLSVLDPDPQIAERAVRMAVLLCTEHFPNIAEATISVTLWGNHREERPLSLRREDVIDQPPRLGPSIGETGLL